MKNFLRYNPRLPLLALLATVAFGLAGCATNEPENASVRPWNSPKGWEHGIPGGITEGR